MRFYDNNHKEKPMKPTSKLFPPHFAAVVSAALFLTAAPNAHAGLTFNFTTDGSIDANSQAYKDFVLAGQRWSSIFTDNITINLQVGYKSLNNSGQLDSTSVTGGLVSYNQARTALAADSTSAADASAVASLAAGTSYTRIINYVGESGGLEDPYITNTDSQIFLTSANAKAIGLRGASDTAIDATIILNTQAGYELDPAAAAGSNNLDFVGVATNRIGQALGFTSGVDVLDQDANNVINSAATYHASTLDLFRYSTDSVASAAIDMRAGDGASKFFSLDGGKTWGAQFSTGEFAGDGASAGRWKTGLKTGVMDADFAPGDVKTITNADKLAFDAIGYNVAAVPETSLSLTFGLGLVGLGCVWLRKRRT